MDPIAVVSPLQGTVTSIDVVVGAHVRAGDAVVVLESMKMEHVVVAEVPGRVVGILVGLDATVRPGDHLVLVDITAVPNEAEPSELTHASAATPGAGPRPDLVEVLDRHALGHDAARPDAVARRRAPASARRAKTWPTSSTRAASSSTGRW